MVWTNKVLPEALSLTPPYDVGVGIQGKHSVTVNAQSPFRQEEDVAITLRGVHGLLLC